MNKEASKLMDHDIEAFKEKVKKTLEGGNIDGYLLLYIQIYIYINTYLYI
jgi:hypothetical protein